MSKSTSAPAPITPEHLARIKQDAQRGIGASSGDTLRFVHYLVSFRSMCWKSFSEFVKVVDTAQTLTHEVDRLNEEYDKAWRHDLNDKNNVQVLAAEVARLNGENARLLDQIKVLQSDANSWQSGYDRGRTMGNKTILETRAADARLAGFWRSPKEMPSEGAQVVVLRDAGHVGNGQHPGHRCGRWLELTTAMGLMFSCDAISTGNVIGWVGADEFKGLEDLNANAWRYVWLRSKDQETAAHFLGYSDGSVGDSVLDEAMSRDAKP
jgi:hypothetical protein